MPPSVEIAIEGPDRLAYNRPASVRSNREVVERLRRLIEGIPRKARTGNPDRAAVIGADRTAALRGRPRAAPAAKSVASVGRLLRVAKTAMPGKPASVAGAGAVE
jgi:hypothetical protein